MTLGFKELYEPRNLILFKLEHDPWQICFQHHNSKSVVILVFSISVLAII